MRNYNRSIQATLQSIVIALCFSASGVGMAMDQNFWIRKQSGYPEAGFVWQEGTQTFRMGDGTIRRLQDIVEAWGAHSGGTASFGEGSVPWVKLGKIQWVVGADGGLYGCPWCSTRPTDGPLVGGELSRLDSSGGIGSGGGNYAVPVPGRLIPGNCRLLYFSDGVASGWMLCSE